MSKIKTYKGQLPIGQQEKIRLSTSDGLTGYRIRNFSIISKTPGQGTKENIAKIYLTDQTGNINNEVDFSDTDLLAVAYFPDVDDNEKNGMTVIIFDKETFNQDIFVYVVDAAGSTVPVNYYIELDQFKLDLNSSTYHTLKNIRSRTQI